MFLTNPMRRTIHATTPTRGSTTRQHARHLAVLSIASYGIFAAMAQGGPVPNLDLDSPVRDLRLPLIPHAAGPAAGLITAREIRLESPKVGPLRVRVLASPVIEGMVLQLPESADARNEAWAESLADFLILERSPVPLVIDDLTIKRGASQEILQARRATFDALTGRLEMQDAEILDADGKQSQFQRIWLLLKGPQAGFLVWRTADENGAATRHLLDPTAMPDDR